jgi:hypothetical protein
MTDTNKHLHSKKVSDHDYARETKAKGGSVPPDLRRNSKARSEASQEMHMGGHNKQEQKEFQREHALEREQEADRDAETY